MAAINPRDHITADSYWPNVRDTFKELMGRICATLSILDAGRLGLVSTDLYGFFAQLRINDSSYHQKIALAVKIVDLIRDPYGVASAYCIISKAYYDRGSMEECRYYCDQIEDLLSIGFRGNISYSSDNGQYQEFVGARIDFLEILALLDREKAKLWMEELIEAKAAHFQDYSPSLAGKSWCEKRLQTLERLSTFLRTEQ